MRELTTTEDRMKYLEAYAEWMLGEQAVLPAELAAAFTAGDVGPGTRMLAMTDLGQAIQSFVKSVREAERKVLHRETPAKLPEVVLLNLNPKELYFVHHLMALGALAMGGSEVFIRLALAQARVGLRGLGVEAAVSLFDRVNRLSLASFPDAMVIHLSREDV